MIAKRKPHPFDALEVLAVCQPALLAEIARLRAFGDRFHEKIELLEVAAEYIRTQWAGVP